MKKGRFLLIDDAVQFGSELHLISETVQPGFNHNSFVVVKEAGVWGCELHLLSRPCPPGSLQIFGFETEPSLLDLHTSADVDGQDFELITMPQNELDEGQRTTLRMEDPRVGKLLTLYLEYLRACDIVAPVVFVYCRADSPRLQQLRQAPQLSPRDLQLIQRFCPRFLNKL